jgi:hypothetical protein
MATAHVTHPVTGEECTFEYPDDNTDAKIRYEHADSTLGEFDNPNGAPTGDPNTDDVIFDPRTGSWVLRVSSAEQGGSAEVTQ